MDRTYTVGGKGEGLEKYRTQMRRLEAMSSEELKEYIRSRYPDENTSFSLCVILLSGALHPQYCSRPLWLFTATVLTKKRLGPL